ncbi:MucR family transcriptional regulator (plasmid) [Roseibium aggregatum]|jgi:predicted transcriptional regulator|uniref:MucR family transcriptional regulator n=1 Tax=Roseibium aggregatum TaxID=187304 RepID=UPI001E36E319|nr:MucR family transcriptional regulator [Roseibium aggregatum]UES59936.1 MucR family transcriptional regulator [Roseibium aggregatum]
MTKKPENDITQDAAFVELTSEIVSSYVSNNTVASPDLADLITSVHKALTSTAQKALEPLGAELTPAVPIKKSVTGDYIICLEDGKKFKSLKRHLRSHYDLSPKDYRAKWNLPPDYPMVAPNYAAARSRLAKKMGLGKQNARKSQG